MRKLGDAAVPQAECWLNVALSLRRCYIFYRENVSTVCSNSAHSSNTLPGFEDQNASWNRNRNIDFLLTFSDFIVEVEREGGDYYYSELSFLKQGRPRTYLLRLSVCLSVFTSCGRRTVVFLDCGAILLCRTPQKRTINMRLPRYGKSMVPPSQKLFRAENRRSMAAILLSISDGGNNPSMMAIPTHIVIISTPTFYFQDLYME